MIKLGNVSCGVSIVENFANEIKTEIVAQKLDPLLAIICNAFTWSISSGLQFTVDGYFSMCLRLTGGESSCWGSDAHFPGKSGLEKYPPLLPDDLDLLVKPGPDREGEETGRGFQRYGISKVVAIMGMYQLNARLQKSPSPHLRKITALALDPGGLPDSRCMSSGSDVPAMWTFLMKGILNPLFLGLLRPVFKHTVPKLSLRSTSEAAVDLVEMAVGEGFRGERGHFVMGERDESSPETRDEGKQRAVWGKSLEWAGIGKGDTGLGEGIE
ncbi:hypothetical protein EYC80_008818 [Monilinia laxa]|uniref:Ketoreductase (KR) domain-containing protein n=1 Tax=Monilinia laxa TaxID=61186 RepID=A0A5N6K1K2_MONLA|nr:hypothetical protein EYC80_008818 [Monilinia laxa]